MSGDRVLALLHITTAVVAMVSGGFVVASMKGTTVHRIVGYLYVVSMALLNASALAIFRLTGTFGPFHVAALISLATVIAGFAPALLRKPSGRWLELHLKFMAWSYIGLLAAAASEAMVRIPSAPFWPAVVASSVVVCVIGGPVLARRSPRLVETFAPRQRSGWCVAALFVAVAGAVSAVWAAGKGDPAEILGTWRGTSTCVNRKVAPACKDETIIYEVRPAQKPKAVILNADKVVNGERLPMGELEFVYSDKDGCWRGEFDAPRGPGVWCLVVEGRNLTGSLRSVREDAEIRKVQAVHD